MVTATSAPGRRRQRAFTIIEIMITIVILGVLASVAAPSMRDMLLASKVRSAASDLYESVILARSEAIKRVANVEVTPVSNDWQNGWTVMSGTTVLQSRDATTDVLVAANVAGSIIYRLDGRISSNVRSLTFSSSNTSIAARCVVMDASGRPGIKTDTDGNAANGCN